MSEQETPTVETPEAETPEAEQETPAPPKTPDTIQVSKEEWDRQQSAIAEFRRQAAKAERDAKKAAEDKAKQEGEHLKVAEAAQKERDDALKQLADMQNASRVTDAARRLKFRDPGDALGLLPAETDLTDEAAVTAALERLAGDKPYLLDTTTTPARTGGPAGGGSALSLDEQIAEAEKAGDWKALSRLNVQKLASVKTT